MFATRIHATNPELGQLVICRSCALQVHPFADLPMPLLGHWHCDCCNAVSRVLSIAGLPTNLDGIPSDIMLYRTHAKWTTNMLDAYRAGFLGLMPRKMFDSTNPAEAPLVDRRHFCDAIPVIDAIRYGLTDEPPHHKPADIHLAYMRRWQMFQALRRYQSTYPQPPQP